MYQGAVVLDEEDSPSFELSSGERDAASYFMLHDLRIKDGGLLIIARAGPSERFDRVGGLPLLEDVDPVGLDRIG